jgi:hypothetical protein
MFAHVADLPDAFHLTQMIGTAKFAACQTIEISRSYFLDDKTAIKPTHMVLDTILRRLES